MPDSPATPTLPDDIESSPTGFAEETLGLSLYDWQATCLEWFDVPVSEVVRGSLVTPNGSGKSAVIIPALVLWWLSMHARGRVVITTKDGRQLDGQLQPALSKHRGKFAGWKFIDRYIETPSGGRCEMFTTDEPGRAEGWHKEDDLDGPLLIIADEAKSIPEAIFEAIDRCTYSALFYASSPGLMAGAFHQSQVRTDLGFKRMRVGLSDCPHIPKDRIAQVIAKHGENSPFTRSTLHGEFMAADERSRFDADGLARLSALVKNWHGRKAMRLNRQEDKSVVVETVSDTEAWLHVHELPLIGCRYLVSVDVATGAEQQKGSDDPDAHSVKIIRDAYADTNGVMHNVLESARIVPKFSNINLDVLADFIDRLSRFYGRCVAFIEVNGPGLALIELLKPWGCPVHKRQRFDSLTSRTEEKPGWNTNKLTKPLVIVSLAQLIRENGFDTYDQQTVDQLGSFITHPDGSEAATDGCKDDDVLSLAIGVHNRKFGTMYRERPVNVHKIEDARGYRRDERRQLQPVYRGECS